MSLLLLSAAACASERAPARVSPASARPFEETPGKVTTRLPNVAAKLFFSEVGRQTGLSFDLAGGLGQCRVSAYLTGKSAEETLALLFAAVPAASLPKGRTYVITPRPAGAHPCPEGGSAFPAGSISMLAEQVHARTGVDFIIWGAAVKPDLRIRANGDLKKFLSAIREAGALGIRAVGGDYAVSARGLDETGEIPWPTETLHVEPGTKALFVPDPSKGRGR